MAVLAALELRGLTRRYGERLALADVTLSVAAGQTLAVLGPNGAGKTTLLRLLATLLRPHGGELRVLGHALPGEGWEATCTAWVCLTWSSSGFSVIRM